MFPATSAQKELFVKAAWLWRGWKVTGEPMIQAILCTDALQDTVKHGPQAMTDQDVEKDTLAGYVPNAKLAAQCGVTIANPARRR